MIYNCKVSEDNQNYNIFKNTAQKISVNQAYSHFKTEEKEWLNQCPSQILRNASATWYTAKQRFFKGLANNPRKKKKGIISQICLVMNLMKKYIFKNKR